MWTESEFILHKVCILYLQPQQEQYRFNCIVIPLLSHMLSSKTEAFIVPLEQAFLFPVDGNPYRTVVFKVVAAIILRYLCKQAVNFDASSGLCVPHSKISVVTELYAN